MSETQSFIGVERTTKRERFDGRISLIGDVCQVFKRGYEDGVLAFQELKEACRFPSTLIRFFDRDAEDLCLLASHAENMEQFKLLRSMSRERWVIRKDEEE